MASQIPRGRPRRHPGCRQQAEAGASLSKGERQAREVVMSDRQHHVKKGMATGGIMGVFGHRKELSLVLSTEGWG